MTSTEPTTTILTPDQLDDATTHYLVTALWSSPGDGAYDGDGPEFLDGAYDVGDVADESVVAARAAVVAFVESAGAEDVRAYLGAFNGDAEQVGHDLWLTRNGHGVGFWARGLGELGDRLTAHARTLGEISMVVGDDGLIHAE